MYPVGTTLRIDYVLFSHYGISDGAGNVIHNSKNKEKVAIETEADFAEGKKIELSYIQSSDSLTSFKNAKKYIGLPYELFADNSESFVKFAHGYEPESTLIRQYIAFLIGLGMGRNENTYFKYIGNAEALSALLEPTDENPYQNSVITRFIRFGLEAIEEGTNVIFEREG